MSKTIKGKIGQFIDVLLKVANSEGQLFDNGLIVIEDESNVKFEDIESNLNDFIKFDKVDNHVTFINSLVVANKDKKIILVKIEHDLDPKIISILKQISVDNTCNISDFNNEEIYHLKINQKVRIICITKRSVIENSISYPYFYNLFGPVLVL